MNLFLDFIVYVFNFTAHLDQVSLDLQFSSISRHSRLHLVTVILNVDYEESVYVLDP